MIRKEILMVGYGAMGSALGEIWEKTNSLTIIDPVHSNGLRHPDDLSPNYQPDIVVLAVKPQLLLEILPLYQQRFTQNSPLWVSIAAGVPLDFFQRLLPFIQIVRAMPNLAVRFQQGLTALFSTTGQVPLIEELFKLGGQTLWLEEENQIDAVTAVAGSGPAYFYAMVESLASAAHKLGLTADISMILARQTAIGAGFTLNHLADSAASLRQQVTSPNGTTAAALEVLMDSSKGLTPLMQQTVKAAHQRAITLGQEQLK